MKIIKQGAVRVNDYTIVYQNDDVVCLELDLHSKYADTPGFGLQIDNDNIDYPVLYLVANENTLHVDETYPRKSSTDILFDEFPDFDFFCIDGPYRYTVRFVLIKKIKAVH